MAVGKYKSRKHVAQTRVMRLYVETGNIDVWWPERNILRPCEIDKFDVYSLTASSYRFSIYLLFHKRNISK